MPTKDDAKMKKEMQEELIKAVRKNPQKYLKHAVKKEYFRDENQETVILNIVISGLGRAGRRRAAKEMKTKWIDFLEMESIVIEKNIDTIPNSVKLGWLNRRTQEYKNGKISQRDYHISTIIIEQNISYDKAEKRHDNYVKHIKAQEKKNAEKKKKAKEEKEKLEAKKKASKK
jgi:hypothetical protein